MTTPQTPVRRDDLEAKLREIEGVVVDFEEEAKSRTILIAAGVTVVVVGVVVYGMWLRRRNRIKVEVYRL